MCRICSYFPECDIITVFSSVAHLLDHELPYVINETVSSTDVAVNKCFQCIVTRTLLYFVCLYAGVFSTKFCPEVFF